MFVRKPTLLSPMGTNGEHLCSGEQIFGKHDARISSLAMVYIHMSFAKQPPRRVGRGAAVTVSSDRKIHSLKITYTYSP